METLSGARKLRFAILCDEVTVEAWQLRSIEALQRSGVAQCVAVVLPARPSAKRLMRRSRLNRYSLYNLFFRLVSRRSAAKVPMPIAAVFPNVPVLSVETEPRPRGRTAITKTALEDLANLDLDFAVRFGFGILSGEVLHVPRHGVWSYHHGDPARFRGQPPGVWEIYHRSSVTGAVVQRLSEDLDGGEILARASFPTEGGSYLRQLDMLLDGSASLLANAALNLVHNRQPPAPVSGHHGPNYTKPTNRQMLKLAWIMTGNRLRAILRSVFRHQHWALVITECSLGTLLRNGMNVPLDRYLEGAMYIPEEKGLFAADPFLIPGSHSAQDGPEIVFERFDWRSGKGHIATVRATQHGRFSPPTSALELSTHLSYPFVLEHNGVSTILPESCEGGKLVEYVLDPSGMSARAVRDHGEAVTDPTIVFHNGRYWMFYCRGTKNSELCIRHAQDSSGPWTEHVLNPVKIDVCNARPAGSFLQYDGQLYRPAQICAPHYGLGIVFNKIVRLDETSFSEEPVASIVQSRSGRYRHGVHTIAREGDTLVFDHARLIFSPREAMRVLSAKFGKLFV